MFAQVFVGGWDGISRCFHGDKGNVSRSLEFRPGKVLTDKQNEKVSSLASAIPSLFSPLTRLLLSPISPSVCSPPSSLFPPLRLLNTSPCYLYLRLQMPSLSSSIILHLLNFSLVLLLCCVFDISFRSALHPGWHVQEPQYSHCFFFLPFFFFHTFGSLHSTFASVRCLYFPWHKVILF